MNPTLPDIQTLHKRPELLRFLREASNYPDSVLTALGYLLWTIQQEKKDPA